MLILCLYLELIISPVSNFPCKFLYKTFKFRSVDIHYHSWIIRSEAWWRRPNWQSNCFSAGTHSWAPEMCCIMPLNPADINKHNSSYHSDSTVTCLCDEKTHNQRQRHLNLWCIFKKYSYTKDFIMFHFLPDYRKLHNESHFFLSSLCCAEVFYFNKQTFLLFSIQYDSQKIGFQIVHSSSLVVERSAYLLLYSLPEMAAALIKFV